MNKYGSRKFIIAVLVLVTATWLRIEALIESTDFVRLAIAVLGLYGLSNVGQKVWGKDAAAQ
jgi:hypothetical protein